MMKSTKKNLLLIILPYIQLVSLILIIFGGMTPKTYSQGICIPSPLITRNISGKVVAELIKSEMPLPNSAVRLLEDRYQGRVITETNVGTNGEFSFHHIRPGKYLLRISSPNLSPFDVRVRLVRAKALKVSLSEKEIIVLMGADATKPCDGSRVEIRTRKKT